MRAIEFIYEQLLSEISMKPSALRQLAAKTGAVAGIEFEMVVPDVEGGDDDDGQLEADFDQDERVTDFSSIEDFFDDGDINSRRDVKSLLEALNEQYMDWALDSLSEQWVSDGREFFDEYAEDHFDDLNAREEAEEQIRDEYGDELSPEDLERMVDSLVEENKQEWLDQEWEDQGRIYEKARESWEEGAEWPDQGDFLRSEGYRYMSDLPYGDYDLSWPHYTSSSSGGGSTSIEEVADEFKAAIGRPVNASSSYHGGRRESNTYVIEPDSSIDASSSDDRGLEFVSPPLPLDEMLNDFGKVIEWAKQRGCYTNSSTGLHMNVSVPNFSNENLDYVKLALLLGDRYVLQQFGRAMNTYTSSALNTVLTNIKKNPESAQALLQKMKSGLEQTASKVIHSGSTSKYTSINTHSGYIEFRSPGGDWLEEDWTKLESTLLRFVVALDAACDPQKYRKEYLKKLYAVLQPKTESDPIAVFAKFSAGMLTKPELQQYIKQIRQGVPAKTEPQSASSLPQGSRRWKIMQNGQEIYSFINRDNQNDANAYAVNWLNTNMQGWREEGPVTVEPV